jgi:hypothetical protein
MVVEATGIQVDDGVFRYAIIGLGSWFLLRLVGVRGPARIAGTIAATWYLGKDA